MSGGALKIDLLSVNSVVKTAEMQTAVHKGVLDGAHMVTAYWYSKSPVASLFGTGPCFGWNANQLLGWVKYGGGRELYYELMDALKLDLVGFFNSPMPAQPLGWFKEQITDSSRQFASAFCTWRVGCTDTPRRGADIDGQDGIEPPERLRCTLSP